MKKEELNKLFDFFGSAKVLVIGDVMLDAYYWGNVERISPEAPVPVVHVKKTEDRLGGAANVALNLQALGAEPIICSVIGNDRRGQDLIQLLKETKLSVNGIISSGHRKTTVKTRIISNHQQMLRVDEEQINDLNNQEELELIAGIIQLMDSKKPDVIIFEDYNKGVLTETVIAETIKSATKKGIPTCVDPKLKNFFSYNGVTLFKPNLKELREGLKLEIDRNEIKSIHVAAEQLQEKLQHTISLITLSELGVFVKNKNEYQIFPAHIRNIADVSGAGDTVIAVASLCLAAQQNIEIIARLSNLAGGLVCEKIGVVPIDKNQLLQEAYQEFNV